MLKIRLSVIILNSILMLGLIVFGLFTYLQVSVLKPKYGLSEDYISFSLEEKFYSPIKENKVSIIFEEIKDIVYNEKITIINYNISRIGLGVYDSNGKYKNFNLLKGNDIDYEKFDNKILLKSDSYYKDRSIITSLSGKKLEVVGYYNDGYPLFNEDIEYIYNIFADPTVNGEFYIETESQDLTNKIFNIFETHDYIVNINEANRSVFSIFSNGLYLISLLGMVFIYFNLFMFYFHYYDRIKKPIKVHILYGAEYKNVILLYLKNFVINIVIGSSIGVCLYYILFKSSYLQNNEIIFISFVLNLIFNIFLFVICLRLKKANIYNTLCE